MVSLYYASQYSHHIIQVQQKRHTVGDHRLEDIIAQSSCAAYMPVRQPTGWVYAVYRHCVNAPSCDEVCSSKYLHVQDSQTAKKNNMEVYRIGTCLSWETSCWRWDYTYSGTEDILLWIRELWWRLRSQLLLL